MIKKAGSVLYNLIKLLLLYVLFHVVLFLALPIAWVGSSKDDASMILVISFFSLLGTYFPKIEKISSIIFLISICLFFILR